MKVIELLKHAPQCKLDFAKFIPAYHHHFGRQCRVADYGCTKLVELFETIPDTVQVSPFLLFSIYSLSVPVTNLAKVEKPSHIEVLYLLFLLIIHYDIYLLVRAIPGNVMMLFKSLRRFHKVMRTH